MAENQQNPPATLPANFGGWDKPPDSLPANFAQWDQHEAAQPGALSRFVSGAASQFNPISMVKGTVQLAAHPIDTYVSDAQARGETLDHASANVKTAKELWNQGHYLSAIDHLGGSAAQYIYSMIPFAGTQLEQAGQKIASGDIAGGTGQSVGMGLAMAGPAALVKAIPKIAPTVAKAAGSAASFASDVVDPEITGIFSPRLAHMQRVLGKIGDRINASEARTPNNPMFDFASESADQQGPQTNPSRLLPPGPIDLPASTAAIESGQEGVLPAQKIIVRDPATGKMKVMYGSGTGPTLYQQTRPINKTFDLLDQKLSEVHQLMDEAGFPKVGQVVPEPARPITSAGEPIDTSDLSGVLKKSIAAVKAKKKTLSTLK